MTNMHAFKSRFAAATLVAAFSTAAMVISPAPAMAQSTGKTIVLSIGRGQQVNLGSAITDVVVSDPRVADVEVKSATQIYIIAKGAGETTVYATSASGKTIYSATIRVGTNMDSISQMLSLAMPEAQIRATTMNGVVLLTGTASQPEDAAEAERLVDAFINPSSGSGGGGGSANQKTVIINRIKAATPLQVNLQVRIAEVSRSLAKEISGNLKTQDPGGTNGIAGGIFRGRDIADISTVKAGAGLPLLDASAQYGFPKGTLSLPFDPQTGKFVTGDATSYLFKVPAGGNAITAAGKLFGLNVAAAFDASEKAGLISTLANPNLTTVSGETADFLAGGSFPIVTSSNNGTSIEYKTYGVGLTYTPTVLADGRISLRLRTEVSDISSQGAVRIGGIEVPATTQRSTETTVELGSGQSMMIAGLLSNQLGSSVDKMPGAGDIPILGALFKSNGWRHNESELMIVITPYLVKPVSDSEIKLPTDGIHSPNDLERVLLGKLTTAKGDPNRPMPTLAPTAPKGPEFGAVSDAAPSLQKAAKQGKAQANASGPGFSF
jgi:pilus assembly protein CpaC